ncbi:MAG: saccharopine dehydrogenase family protein, partial [Deltaproteobacteria bacterium]|nr:saccharopine dehydrogenase family protein [Deltaproteobacteria bacterium]
RDATLKLLKGSHAVLSALPYYCNLEVATLADKTKIHYFDLTEDVQTAKEINDLARKSRSGKCFMPQCGLAPGFISIAASYLINSFVEVDTVKMRVGALPIYPSNRLKYNLTWSTEGLINEYGNPCQVIDDGQLLWTLPLEGYERFSLDGVEYEAFNTSGGLGTLCETMQGRVRKLDYKSVRYPGHRDLCAFLMQDLRFNTDRETLRKVFERSISTTAQDKCLIFINVVGTVKGRLKQRTYASTVYNNIIHGEHYGAIQITTACGICAPLDLVLNGKIKKKKGFLKAEDIPLMEFLNNRFGKYYRDDKALMGIAV